MSARLAVLVTYHNEGPLLTSCLRSVLDAPAPPDEVIVYDDASALPAQSFVPAGVRVIRGEANVGPARGRNRLLVEATADYVHFHDADDLFAPTWSARVRAAIADAAPDVVFTEIRSEDEAGCAISERVTGIGALCHGLDLLRFSLQGGILVPASTCRRAVVAGLGGYREDLWQSEDYDFHVRLASTQPAMTVVDEPLVTIRVREGSRSQDRLAVWRSAVQAIPALADLVPSTYRDDVADAAARFGSQLYRLGATAEAADAFRLACRVGRPRFAYDSRAFRLAARTVGPHAAEWLGARYRRLLPAEFRRAFQRVPS